MKRCRICGRPPSEVCCTRCHEVHRKGWQKTADRTDTSRKGLAQRVLAGLDNTEEVNQ